MCVAVLSGNRNFERIHPNLKSQLPVQPTTGRGLYAIAGNVRVDLMTQPVGTNRRQTGVPGRHLAEQRRGTRS